MEEESVLGGKGEEENGTGEGGKGKGSGGSPILKFVRHIRGC